MNKKYYIIIAVLSVLLAIIIGLISVKNIKTKNNTNDQDNQTEKQEKTYTGNIRCEKEDKDNIDIYMPYFIDTLEVENNNVMTSETKRKLEFNNNDNYNGFKENSNVLNPVYDDENLIVEYVLNEKKEIDPRDIDEYVKSLENLGYKCEKVID